MQASQATTGSLAARTDMIAEGRRIIDAARRRGAVLRLMGGLAVREHCEVLSFCERDYSDLDMVGSRAHYKELPDIFKELGYTENYHVRQATNGRQMQFYRDCQHPDSDLHYFLHPDDHVDVFLETFRMDHEVPLKERLEIEDYTIPLSDVLLTKLQTVNKDEKDVRDILTLLKDVPLVAGQERGVINPAYIAKLCAADWGLYYDVTVGIERSRQLLHDYPLDDADAARVAAGLDTLVAAIEAAPKPTKWKLRAKVGTRRPWRNEVEEQDGEEHGPPLPGGD